MTNRLLNIINSIYPNNRKIWINTCSTNGNWYLITLFFQNEYRIISLREVHYNYSDERIIEMIK